MNDAVRLVRVTEPHKSVLANLLQLYLYDFSSLRDVELSTHGTYSYRYLDHYFVEAGREPLFILVGDRLAGFALVRHVDGVNLLAEFFVVAKHRRLGVGRSAAHALFRRYPGEWSLEYYDANAAARQFWPDVVRAVATGEVGRRRIGPPETDLPATQLTFTVG
ncbi:GNAT family N-acetyltransferase [Actinopolymorpha singaporensis]|uniref:Predicted acetyltransferase n=1 Tax=Actinopolymorpha singaporensis TaxID=117157 RepID=A0A1H1WUX1_9ACTN|nr:GNAT family N-acetyltransferase [Actinopolymorpha singaporensis]SDT01078.1 Predicted acetyltransferase [Actinopolymorpha singaporensis]